MPTDDIAVVTSQEHQDSSPQRLERIPKPLRDSDTITFLSEDDASPPVPKKISGNATLTEDHPTTSGKRNGIRDPSNTRRKRYSSGASKNALNSVADCRPRMSEVTTSFGHDDDRSMPSRSNSGKQRQISASTVPAFGGITSSTVQMSPNQSPTFETDATNGNTRQPLRPPRNKRYPSEGSLMSLKTMNEAHNMETRLRNSTISNGSTQTVNMRPYSGRNHDKAPLRIFDVAPSPCSGKAPEKSFRRHLGQFPTRSTPSLYADEHPSQAIENLRARLNAFEGGNLPPIRGDLQQFFPQDLPRHDSVNVERMWTTITEGKGHEVEGTIGNPNRKSNVQQLAAIMELVKTEACYLKTLEMIIDVHVAVYVDLSGSMNSQVTNGPSRVSSFNSFSGEHTPTSSSNNNHTDASSFTAHNLSYSGGSGGGAIRDKVRSMVVRRRQRHRVPGLTSSLSNLVFPSHTPGKQDFFSTPATSIFGNIGDVYRVNQQFWTDYFEPYLLDENTIDVRNFIRSMRKAFAQFDRYFEPYIAFLDNYNTLISTIKYLERHNKLFSAYHEWTRNSNPQGCRDSLPALLTKPFQRLTRYGILLKRIKDFTTDEYEISELEEMIAAVNNFVRDVDYHQPDQDALTNLESFIGRIASYGYAKTVRSELGIEIPSSLEDLAAILRSPMAIEGRSKTRKKLAEVNAKVKYVGGKISNGFCILLSDMILICKQTHSRDELCLQRPPIALSSFSFSKNDSPGTYVAYVTNQFDAISETYLISGDANDLDEWFSNVKIHKQEFESMLLVKRNSSGGSSRCAIADTPFVTSPSSLLNGTTDFGFRRQPSHDCYSSRFSKKIQQPCESLEGWLRQNSYNAQPATTNILEEATIARRPPTGAAENATGKRPSLLHLSKGAPATSLTPTAYYDYPEVPSSPGMQEQPSTRLETVDGSSSPTLSSESVGSTKASRPRSIAPPN